MSLGRLAPTALGYRESATIEKIDLKHCGNYHRFE